jgi:hypothetical protein
METSDWQTLSTFAQSLRVEPHLHVYCVGSFDFKKTIRTQQIRAAALALAVHKSLPSVAGPVAVIGAGFSGISAAATLLKLGREVHIFERRDEFIPIQDGCIDRYLHPNLYEWPLESLQETFEIAGVGWAAGIADTAVLQARASFDAVLVGIRDRFVPEIEVEIIQIEKANDGECERYSLIDNELNAYTGYSAVLLAVGYGYESPNFLGSRVRGYWENSSSRDARGTRLDPTRILISGNGDGGLIEVLTAKIRNFSPGTVLHQFVAKLGEREIEVIRNCEQQIQDRARNENHEYSILEVYDNTLKSYTSGWLEMISGIRRDTHVSFNVSKRAVFNSGSSCINRLLVYALIRNGHVHPIIGRLQKKMVREIDGSRGGYRITWSKNQEEERYDRVVVRHGVDKNHVINMFPSLKVGLEKSRDSYPGLRIVDNLSDRTIDFLRSI